MRFKKGQSGNPGGRPKENQEVQQLAKRHTAAALGRLAYWMASDDPRASVPASVALLDRGWGKPSQSHTAEISGAIIIGWQDE